MKAERLTRLTEKLLSPAVQVQVALQAEDVPARLSPEEVASVFQEHVPGVEHFIYRGEEGNFSLKFIQSAYANGLRAFSDSDIHQHLMSLMRLIVHYGQEKKPDAAKYLREVAEAFMDCQAVQGRTVERVGLQIRGVSLDFRGHLVSLIGEYKATAVKMLAVEECTKLGGPDDWNDPAHFENRLIADIGECVGLNKDHIRQAELDEHAEERFPELDEDDCLAAAARLRKLFDAEALLKAFISEASAFSAESEKDSLPRLFLEWVAEHMAQKHTVFNQDTCVHVQLGEKLALAILEVVFLGRPCCPVDEKYRGECLQGLFHISEAGEAAAGEPEPSVDEADLRRERLARLKQRLLSPAVQMPEVDGLTEVPDKLSAEEVAQVFKDHVPGVEKLLYRQQRGNFSIKFIQSAYSEGFKAFSGSDMHQHLLWLMRLIVHHGHENKPGAATYLREVAEAFTDCQAVQGRTVERIGLQIRGVALDFRGHLVRLAGEYKAMAVKILAVEECTKRGGPDDYNDPPHMESRIIRDLGSGFGLNSSHIKQAMADTHAESRFPKLVKAKLQAAETRLSELFDMDAWLKAFAAEASTLSADSEQESLPRLFLDWASEHMTEKHILLDSDTCSRVEVGDALALAVAEAGLRLECLQLFAKWCTQRWTDVDGAAHGMHSWSFAAWATVVFLGRVGCCRGEEYRGMDIQDLFVPNEELVAEVARAEADKGLVESVAQEEPSSILLQSAADKDGENEDNCASDESNEESEEESGEESEEESD